MASSVVRPRCGVDSCVCLFVAEGRFEFTDVLPGRHIVAVEREGWCWGAEEQEVTVADKDITGIAFAQTGFAMSIEASHAGVSVAIELAESGDQPREIALTQGANHFCLKKAGVRTARLHAVRAPHIRVRDRGTEAADAACDFVCCARRAARAWTAQQRRRACAQHRIGCRLAGGCACGRGRQVRL